MSDSEDKKSFKYLAWPVGLTAFIILFVLALLVTTLITSLQRTDLVTKRYYAEGLDYEEQQERIKRAGLPENKIDIRLRTRENRLDLQFPSNVNPDSVSGSIKLYRPSLAALDRDFKISLDSSRNQSIDLERISRGYWKIKILWNSRGEDFYTEETLVLQ